MKSNQSIIKIPDKIFILWLPDADGPLDDPATAYYASDGSYVVRNDKTGVITQISNKNDPNWIVPWDIED